MELLLCLCASCLVSHQDLAHSPKLESLDAPIGHAMKTWAVPGASVVIVRDDRIIYCKGHGVRAVGKESPITADTLFALSSCSKAFTTAAMALLVEEGTLSWDDPVRQHLPWFRLADPLVEREVRLRDLVCHRTGLAAHELLWHHAPWSPEEAIRRLRHFPLTHPFRTHLQYQSTAFAAAGLSAASAARTSWSDLVRNRLLTPLGMSTTCTSDADAARVRDRAVPHRLDRAGVAEVIPRFDASHPDPAISIHSTARDLGAWLRFHLAEGKPLVAARYLRETHTPQMVIRLSPAQKSVFLDTTQMSYAMGWAVHDHAGLKFISHGGSIDGMRAHITFVPEKKVGIAILCNLEGSPMPLALASTLADQLLGLRKRDWHALHKQLRDKRQADDRQKQQTRLDRRRHGTKPSCDLSAYVGSYEHPAYGIVQVTLSRGRLVWRWRDEEIALEHHHHDTFLLSGDQPGDAELSFALDRTGEVAGFHVTDRLDVTFTKHRRKRS
jgi:CubicO group peptidase (beta-lactamase class C family)